MPKKGYYKKHKHHMLGKKGELCQNWKGDDVKYGALQKYNVSPSTIWHIKHKLNWGGTIERV
jgi:hypothetical protein